MGMIRSGLIGLGSAAVVLAAAQPAVSAPRPAFAAADGATYCELHPAAASCVTNRPVANRPAAPGHHRSADPAGVVPAAAAVPATAVHTTSVHAAAVHAAAGMPQAIDTGQVPTAAGTAVGSVRLVLAPSQTRPGGVVAVSAAIACPGGVSPVVTSAAFDGPTLLSAIRSGPLMSTATVAADAEAGRYPVTARCAGVVTGTGTLTVVTPPAPATGGGWGAGLGAFAAIHVRPDAGTRPGTGARPALAQAPARGALLSDRTGTGAFGSAGLDSAAVDYGVAALIGLAGALGAPALRRRLRARGCRA